MLDTFQRYKEAYFLVEKVSNKKREVTLLDVGSNGPGFATYNKFENVRQTNLDIQEFQKNVVRKYLNIKFVTYSGNKFPFEDSSFDIVLCSDTLEHIPKEKRRRFILENLRVSDRYIVFTFPVDTSSFFEKLFYYMTLKKSLFLREHIEYGLPSEEEFENIIKNTDFNIISKSDNINRFLWIPFKLKSSILAKLWKKKSADFILSEFDKYIVKEKRLVNLGTGYSKTFILEKNVYEREI